MTEPTSPCIVVGYDGSPEARAALSLAVERARMGDDQTLEQGARDAPVGLSGHEARVELLGLGQVVDAEDLFLGAAPPWNDERRRQRQDDHGDPRHSVHRYAPPSLLKAVGL